MSGWQIEQEKPLDDWATFGYGTDCLDDIPCERLEGGADE